MIETAPVFAAPLYRDDPAAMPFKLGAVGYRRLHRFRKRHERRSGESFVPSTEKTRDDH